MNSLKIDLILTINFAINLDSLFNLLSLYNTCKLNLGFLCFVLLYIPKAVDPNVLAQQQQAIINQQAIILVSIIKL